MKNTKISRLVLIFSLLIAALLFGACQKQENGANSTGGQSQENNSQGQVQSFRTLQEIKDSGEVKIGVFSDKKPFGYVDDEGKPQGYDVYFGERLAKELGVKPKYEYVEAKNRVEYLKSNKVDIILANFTITPERKEQVDFAHPYMKVALGIVSPKKKLIKSPEDLNGKTLIITKGTTAEIYFEKNYKNIKLEKFESYAEAYEALIDGRGDAFSTDNTEVLAWATEHTDFKVGVESLGDLDYIAPAVAKGNKELLDFINEKIEKLADENFFHKDYEATLRSTYGKDANADDLVVEGGKID